MQQCKQIEIEMQRLGPCSTDVI